MIKAKTLVPMMEQRLDHHINARIDNRRKYHYYSLDFIWDNLASVAAAKCLVGHIVHDLQSFTINECLLRHLNEHISRDSSHDKTTRGFSPGQLGGLLFALRSNRKEMDS